MDIPKYDQLLTPLLKCHQDDGIHSTIAFVDKLVGEFCMSEDEINYKPEGWTQTMFRNRIGWAYFYLKKAGLLENVERGYYKITQKGQRVLAEATELNAKNIKAFNPEGFKASKNVTPDKNDETKSEDTDTPLEMMDTAYRLLEDQLVDDVLNAVLDVTPNRFEEVVLDVLGAMGYGGAFEDSFQVTQYSHDEGIDGIIKEDKLGLSKIYVQAKRWKPGNTIGSKDLNQFVGAITGKKATKGVFITTSKFTKNASEYAKNVGNIVLVDGDTLARLMIEFNVGISTRRRFDIKYVDTDYYKEN